MAIFAAFIMLFAMMPYSGVVAASSNTVALTLYNDSVIPEGESSPMAYTDSYTWQMSKNISNVFRLVIDMSFSRLYKAKDVELTINAFGSAGRNEAIVRKSFGNESGVFKEVSSDGNDIFAINTAPINGSASVSVTYQIKPEDIKDIGSLGKPLNLSCMLKAGSETVTSNTITFSTDFSQGWSIINSGEHTEAYDEIEAFAVNEDAPLTHKERLKTVDGVFVDANKVSESNYQWVEYRVPLLTDDPLGIYKHYIEIHVPDGCIFYSAQTDNEDAQVTPCENLDYSVEKNTVTVNCADFLNSPHSADATDSYYYFVMALDKNKYNNFNVVEFKEKHVHKDNSSIVVYSENTESLNLSFNKLSKYIPSTSNVFNIGIAMDDFRTGYIRDTTAVLFSTSVSDKIKVSSSIPFTARSVNSSIIKYNLNNDEFSIYAVDIPAHYLNDNGEVVYGVKYELYTSQNGKDYSVYKSGTLTEDTVEYLPDNTDYAYVIYGPSDTSISSNIYTYGAGAFSYKVSPSFIYKFTVNDTTFERMKNEQVKYVAISAAAESCANSSATNSITNFISIDKLFKEYRLSSSAETNVAFSGNHYDVSVTHGVDFNTNTSQKIFSEFELVSILPSNYYGHKNGSVNTLQEAIENTISLYSYSDDGTETAPLVLYKYNDNGTVETKTVSSQNIKELVTVNVEKKDDNLKVIFDINFGDYSTLYDGLTMPFLISYTWPMSRIDAKDLGKKKIFDMISALYASEVGSVPAGSDSMLMPSSNYFSAQDNGSFANNVSSVSITKDILSDANGNNNIEETAYFAKSNISVLDTGETAQTTSIAVKTEYTPFCTSTYTNPAITGSDKEYELRFSFEGYSSAYSDIVFVSNLGNGEEDLSDWLGTFKSAKFSAGTTALNGTELIVPQTVVYYQANTVNVNNEMSEIKNGKLFEDDLGSWKLLNEETDCSKIKAVAVKVKPVTYFVEETVVSVSVFMQSNSDRSFNEMYNRVNFGCVATPYGSETRSSATSEHIVIKQFNPAITYIKRIKVSDVNFANGNPTFIVKCVGEKEGASLAFRFDENSPIVNISGTDYYELSHSVELWHDFNVSEKDSLRYGMPEFSVDSKVGTVNEDNTVLIEVSADSREITIVSVSEKEIHNMLSHTALCINEFNNIVEEK